jgi:hypothetical protein
MLAEEVVVQILLKVQQGLAVLVAAVTVALFQPLQPQEQRILEEVVAVMNATIMAQTAAQA